MTFCGFLAGGRGRGWSRKLWSDPIGSPSRGESDRSYNCGHRCLGRDEDALAECHALRMEWRSLPTGRRDGPPGSRVFMLARCARTKLARPDLLGHSLTGPDPVGANQDHLHGRWLVATLRQASSAIQSPRFASPHRESSARYSISVQVVCDFAGDCGFCGDPLPPPLYLGRVEAKDRCGSIV